MEAALLDIDALYYEIGLIKADKISTKQDFEATWKDIQERMRENRERASTGEFRQPLAGLTNRLDEYFDLAELGELAFNLNVNLEKISSSEGTKWDLIIDLVNHFQRRDRLDVLIRAADEARPHIERPFSEFIGKL